MSSKMFSQTSAALLWLLTLGAAALTGCSQRPADTVVRVADQEVSAQELLAIAQTQGLSNSAKSLQRLAHLTAKDMAAEQRLVAEGWHQDPAFIQARRRFISAYVNERINRELVSNIGVSEDEIAAYFQVNKHAYGRPKQFRVALIDIAKKDHGENTHVLASKLHAQLAALPAGKAQDRLFNQLAAKHSSHLGSRFQGGDVGYMQENDSAWPAPLLRAVFATSMSKPLGQLITTPSHAYIYRVLGQRQAIEASLEDHREKIRGKLLTQKHDAMRSEGRNQLLKGIDIDIDEQMIKSIASAEENRPREPANIPAG